MILRIQIKFMYVCMYVCLTSPDEITNAIKGQYKTFCMI